MKSDSFTIPAEFTEHVKNKKAWSPKDYVKIMNMCTERGVHATRHHIKSVIENQNTTNQKVYDVITSFYAVKIKSIENAMALIPETSN